MANKGERRNCIDCGTEIWVKASRAKNPDLGLRCHRCNKKVLQSLVKERKEQKEAVPKAEVLCSLCGGSEGEIGQPCKKCGLGVIEIASYSESTA